MAMSEADNEKLTELLIRWEEAWDHGEDIPASQLCSDCPELAEELAGQIDALKKMAWMKDDATDDTDNEVELSDPLISKTLGGRYRIDELIAEGGFGRVYRGFDPELQRPVAIKIPKAGRVASAEQADFLLEEARRVAKLRHPGIVAVHDVGRDDGVCFIVTDLIDGTNLAEVIANKRPTPQDAARLVAQIAEHLHAAHDQGFIHRDIKPSNILIDAAGKPLIADFGIAATIKEVEHGQAVTSGTLPYMAPEQIAGEVQLIDARTDIHALGVLLYELLTGIHPYQARTPTVLREQILFRQPKAIRTINPVVPRELERICLRCIAKHPADRFASAEQAGKALRDSISGEAKRWRRRFLLGIVAILLVFLGAKCISMAVSHWMAIEQSAKPENVFVFDGISRIVTPLERFAPVTLEAWVRPERRATPEYSATYVIGSDINGYHGIGLGTTGGRLHAQRLAGIVRSKQIVPLRTWSHLAVVFASDETRLYFNGRLVATGLPTQNLGGTPFVIGCLGEDTNALQFVGQIRCLRISTGERYKLDFVPDNELKPDDTAILIYGGGAVDGGKVVDLSGNGNHGQWQKSAVNKAEPPVREHLFVFHGTNRILTPLERFAPATLEAWVRPSQYDEGGNNFIIGSDIPSRGGNSLMVCSSVLMAEYVHGEALIPSDQVVPLDQWSHVAVVFAADATRLYFNGRLIATGPATKALGGTNFVIGGAGRHNHRHSFKGRIRSVRISRGERYTEDFTPEEQFQEDAEDAATKAVVIYDGSRTDGDRVIDLSGEGNDGTWDGLSNMAGSSSGLYDTKIADLILQMGGQVRILDSTGMTRLLNRDEIPRVPFYVVEVKVLSNSDFDDDELQQLVGLSRLESLYLANTRITDDGMAAVGAIASLQGLGIGNTDITDAGIAHLTELKKLGYLNISNTQITDSVFRYLVQMENLRQLHVTLNSVSQEAIETFKRQKPNCLVSSDFENVKPEPSD